MRIDVGGQRRERTVGHAHRDGRRVLERIGHRQQKDLHRPGARLYLPAPTRIKPRRTRPTTNEVLEDSAGILRRILVRHRSRRRVRDSLRLQWQTKVSGGAANAIVETEYLE